MTRMSEQVCFREVLITLCRGGAGVLLDLPHHVDLAEAFEGVVLTRIRLEEDVEEVVEEE